MRVILSAVSHSFRDAHALFDYVSADLVPGEMIALAGPSGSGKSTLLGIIAGWISPRWGKVHRLELGKLQWVLQQPHGSARRTALDHAVLPLLALGWTRREAECRATRTLTRFGLEHAAHNEFRNLSGGEAQRLMLVRALHVEPDLLLIDEPTAQLDRSSAAEVVSVLREVASARRVVVVASHDDDVVVKCDRRITLSAPRATGHDESS